MPWRVCFYYHLLEMLRLIIKVLIFLDYELFWNSVHKGQGIELKITKTVRHTVQWSNMAVPRAEAVVNAK